MQQAILQLWELSPGLKESIMSVGSSAADYLQQEINLTPTGGAFPADDSTNWVKLLDAFSQTFARIDANAVLLMNESFPDTTTQLLPNWERVAGLPDACSNANDTIEVRRFNLLTKLTSRGGQSKAYFIQLAATLGYTITITELRPFRTGKSRTGDGLCGTDFWFSWQINSQLNTVNYFRAGKSSADDPLAFWSNTRLECFMNRVKPAHTLLSFVYT